MFYSGGKTWECEYDNGVLVKCLGDGLETDQNGESKLLPDTNLCQISHSPYQTPSKIVPHLQRNCPFLKK